MSIGQVKKHFQETIVTTPLNYFFFLANTSKHICIIIHLGGYVFIFYAILEKELDFKSKFSIIKIEVNFFVG